MDRQVLRDAHCHAVDGPEWPDILTKLKKDDQIVVMSTGFDNIDKLAEHGQHDGLTPCFGYHPWFTHLVYDDTNRKVSKYEHYKSVLYPEPTDEFIDEHLVEPRPFQDYLKLMKKYLETFSNSLVGELGLDKPFRIPIGKKLSRYRVRIDHQRKIFRLQLELAAELKRPVSIHSVQCHGLVYDDISTASKGIPSVCLHSYSGSTDQLNVWSNFGRKQNISIYLSISKVISLKNSGLKSFLEMLPVESLLTESDLSNATLERLIDDNTTALEEIGRLKNWTREKTENTIKSNMAAFLNYKKVS